MSILLLTGPPGSGKSARLIEAVNAARDSGRTVRTFISRTAVLGAPDPNVWAHGKIGSRDPNMTTALDHLVSSAECQELLEALPAGSVAAFDEAFYFEPDVADQWREAASRGVKVIVSTPSDAQLDRLRNEKVKRVHLAVDCSRCGRPDATETFSLPGASDAITICADCAEKLVRETKADLVVRLREQAPYPGAEAIYQPVEIEECANWQVIRPDSHARVELLKELVAEVGRRAGTPTASYLDLGCNTGFFPASVSRHGPTSFGVDVVGEDIEVARLLTAVIRRDRARFVREDIYEYLRDNHEQKIDIISAFSVVQWLILQRSLQHGLEAFNWLFEKTGEACVVEMGYPSEAIYRDKLPPEIDREWVRSLMLDSGRFAEVRCYEAGERGLMRDVFVGFTRSLPCNEEAAAAAPGVAALVSEATAHHPAPEAFSALEKKGVHVTPVSFYDPVPNLGALPESTWTRESPLVGIDFNESAQLKLLKSFAAFSTECSELPDTRGEPGAFFIGNGMFDGTDALAFYAMVRHFQPRRIVEVGSGYSAAIALRAAALNDRTLDLTAIDPYPSAMLEALRPRLARVIEEPVQETDPAVFALLERGDILFIDSSHVSRIGGDVNHLILEILPQLAEGVLVHFHDIFLPSEYPRAWVMERLRFWNEQYLLQAFLAFNQDFRVLLANHFLGAKHLDALQKVFPKSPWWGGGSFWIQRARVRP